MQEGKEEESQQGGYWWRGHEGAGNMHQEAPGDRSYSR